MDPKELRVGKRCYWHQPSGDVVQVEVTHRPEELRIGIPPQRVIWTCSIRVLDAPDKLRNVCVRINELYDSPGEDQS